MKQRIFISSVQKEFAKERKALGDFLRGDPLLCQFFDVFLVRVAARVTAGVTAGVGLGRKNHFDSAMLRLYKKLCRYYFKIDPEATASYVYAYRDMWDEKG